MWWANISASGLSIPRSAQPVEVGASVGVPAAVDVVVEVEGRVVGARLHHRIVDVGSGDAHPGHDIGVHGQPVFPIDFRRAVVLLALGKTSRDGRRAYVDRPVVDAEKPQPQHRSTGQRRHRRHDRESPLDVRSHLNLQKDGRGGPSPPRPLRSAENPAIPRNPRLQTPRQLMRSGGCGCEAHTRPQRRRRRPGR